MSKSKQDDELFITICDQLEINNFANVTHQQIRAWALKAVQKISLVRATKTLQMDELFHYLTAYDIQNNIVNLKYDFDQVKKLYQDKKINIKHNLLQDTKTTFGEHVSSVRCRKCKSDNTVTKPYQSRAADEPTSYYSQCVSCEYIWRSG